MANRIQGNNGRLHLGDTPLFVVDTQNITINESTSNEQFSVHGEAAAISAAGVDSYTVSFDGLMSTADAGQAEIVKGISITWKWYVTDDETASGPAYSGTMIISSIDRSFPADGRVTFSITADGSGVLVAENTW